MNVYFHTVVAGDLNTLNSDSRYIKQSNHVAIAQLISPPKPLN